jgi:hypothetical protein
MANGVKENIFDLSHYSKSYPLNLSTDPEANKTEMISKVICSDLL